MNSSLLKKALPHITAVFVFLIVSIAYNKTALEGKVLRQADVQGYRGMAQQSNEYKEKNGHWPLWSESMFGGMPAYNIAIQSTSHIDINWINHLFYLSAGDPWKPICFFFSACVCFYILTQIFGLSLLVSLLGSLAYGFATFNPILVAVGHDTELIAIGYMPAVIAGVLLILRGKYLGGTALMTLFFTLEVSIQHLQIVYYTGLIIGCIVICYLVKFMKEKKWKHYIIACTLIGFSLLIGLLNYAYTLMPTKELVSETMRGGKSQLTPKDAKNKTKGGLDKEYAFRWSYGIGETLTLFVPGMQGGGSSGKEITGSSKFAEKQAELGVSEEAGLANANYLAYWGDQPGTSGPVYLGAVICFLFILGMIYVKSWHKWWILSICAAGIVLSWGRHFPLVNYFLFDYFPLYSKFRAPSMALVMPQLGFALLAVLGLQEFTDAVERRDLQLKKFKNVLIISGALVLVSILIYFTSDFKSNADTRVKDNFVSNLLQAQSRGKQPTPEIQQQAEQIATGWMSALREDRKDIFQADLIRSIIFILLASGLCWFYFRGKIKMAVLLAGLLILSSYDLLAEGKKYLSEDSYTEADSGETGFTMTNADIRIKADPEKNFRVLDISGGGDPFSDSRASYFHNSVGGYHPAKLALYNDLIEHQLSKGNQSVFNMLNTKYIIRKGADGKEEAQLNTGAFGSCWLVRAIHFVNNADQEMAALDSINVRDTAIVENIYKDKIPFMPEIDSAARVGLIDNLNDKISYTFKSRTNQFVVFSEIYYDKGWNAFIDGKPAPYCKVDYVLRGMSVPAGDHTIEFRFEPKSYVMGNQLSLGAGIITYLLLIAAALQILGIYPKKSLTQKA
jgi:Bacterial membrane protein YfhO